jgi:predicted RNase H-like nuclease
MSQKQEETSQCLVCDGIANSSRGLCVSHYLQFTRKRKLLAEEQAIAWEKILIEAGKLLPSRQGNRSIDDAFADDFNKFLAGRQLATKVKPASDMPTQLDEIDQDEAEIERVRNKHVAKESTKKPVKSSKKKQA